MPGPLAFIRRWRSERSMTTESAPSAPDLTAELEARLEQLQTGALYAVMVAIACMGVLLLRVPDELLAVGRSLVSAALAFAVVTLAFFVRRWRNDVAAWLLSLGSATLLGLVIHWMAYAPLVFLLALPPAIATILISIPLGLTASAAATLLLVVPSGVLPPVDVGLRAIAVVGIWSIEGALVMTLRPLLRTVEWAWFGYERSRESLEEARTYQQQLHETLEDLTEANAQLMRLNRLAQALRQTADDERRTKEQFVANVSHELRTPLNMIVGFCEMIMETPEAYGEVLSPKLLADLDVVFRNSQHLSGLVDDVLDLSQIEAGQMSLVREHVGLQEILDSAVTAVRPLYQSKSLYLDIDVPADLAPVFCDRIRIREVMLNLLSNAGRFTEEGGVKIKVREDGAQLVISIADTGPGIPEGQQARLFRPFEQLDGTIRRRYGGTGLGLSISRSFVELHGGKMWVESREGKGTVFSFSLPVTSPSPSDGDSFMRWMSPYNPYEPRSRPLRLPRVQVQPRWVILERGDAMRRLLARHLEGIDLVPVRTMEDAIGVLTAIPSQVLLINELDVGQALQRMHDRPGMPYGVPVIVCSIPGVEQAVSELGVSGYLVKPISRESLLSALEQLDPPVESVLIVDDEREALMLFRRMLSSAERPYRVLRARNGQQAIQILQQQLPDVILLDLTMPEMDGFEFLRLRKGAPWEDIPIILISARDPLGHPIVSNSLAVTSANGLSVNQILTTLKMLTTMLSPGMPRMPGDPIVMPLEARENSSDLPGRPEPQTGTPD